MKRLVGILGITLLIVGLVVVNLLVFGGHDGKDDAVHPARPDRTETAERDRVVLPAELVADYRVLVDVVEDGHAPEWGGIAGVALGGGGHGPLSGAAVRLTRRKDVATTTDGQGAFRLVDLPPGRDDVFISAPGFVPALVEDLRIVAGELTRLQVTLQKAQVAFVEVYFGEGGGPDVPVPDAIVRLFPGNASSWAFDSHVLANSGISARTGEDGRARFDQVRPGAYYAIVQAPNHPVWRGDIPFVKADDVARIDLPGGGTIAGRVQAGDGGPGAGHVLIGPVDRVSHSDFYYGVESVSLDERGEFRFKGVPEGEHHLVALLCGGEVAVTEDALSVTAGDTIEVELVASRTARIHGRVADQIGGPLAGAQVHMSTAGGLHPEAKRFPGYIVSLRELQKRSTLSDAEGRYILENVRTAAGAVELTAKLEGHARETALLSVGSGQDLTLDFVLASCDSVVGGRFLAPFPGDLGGITVIAKLEGVDQGAPSFSGTTRADGAFEIAVPSAGTFTVLAAARDLSPPCRIEPSMIHAVPSGSRDVTFTLLPKNFLRVRAVDEEGGALAALEISLYDDLDQCFYPSRVEHSSAGYYEVLVDPERHLFATLCSAGFEPTEIWDLARKLDEVLVVKMSRSGEDVPIRVVDADGSPIAGAVVSLAWFGARGSYPPHSAIVPVVRTDEAGEGVLRAVPVRAPRDFLVAPGLGDAPPLVHIVAAKVGGSGGMLLLTIPRSLKIEVELKGPGGEPAQGVCLILSAEGVPVTTRAFARLHRTETREAVDTTRPVEGKLVLHLEPGWYTLHYSSPGALAGDIRIFNFAVSEDGPSSFLFQVDG
ncbi:MAG: carboxypeptidase regulatory-like domain-containing protein [Planctomycetes bacterium]|nr:carboxypeptidase regulatory-like domain-containing protein [Planctomycetota bacterium]